MVQFHPPQPYFSRRKKQAIINNKKVFTQLKKIIAVLLAVCLVVSLACVTALASEVDSGTLGEFEGTYDLTLDDSSVISIPRRFASVTESSRDGFFILEPSGSGRYTTYSIYSFSSTFHVYEGGTFDFTVWTGVCSDSVWSWSYVDYEDEVLSYSDSGTIVYSSFVIVEDSSDFEFSVPSVPFSAPKASLRLRPQLSIPSGSVLGNWQYFNFNIAITDGSCIWTDGTDLYYSYLENQYFYDDGVWRPKLWNGLVSFYGNYVWSDGTNYFYSRGSDQYILNGDTWEPFTWSGLTDFYGYNVWTDGESIFYSSSSSQFVLNDGVWEPISWLSSSYPQFGTEIWTDGTYIYYNYGTVSLVKNGLYWQPVTWSHNFDGRNVFKVSSNYYCLYQGYFYRITDYDLTVMYSMSLYGFGVWSDGDSLFVSYNGSTYINLLATLDVYATELNVAAFPGSPEFPWVLSYGEDASFAYAVEGVGDYDSTCTIELVGAPDGVYLTQYNDTTTWTLHNTPTDSSWTGSYSILITSNQDSSLTYSIPVTAASTGDDGSVAYATELNAYPYYGSSAFPWSLVYGDKVSFVYAVQGVGDYDNTCTVELVGAPDGVYLGQYGDTTCWSLFNIPTDSTWTGSYSILITSNQDSSLTYSIPVTVESSVDSSGDGSTCDHSGVIEWLHQIWQAIVDGFDSVLTKLDNLVTDLTYGNVTATDEVRQEADDYSSSVYDAVFSTTDDSGDSKLSGSETRGLKKIGSRFKKWFSFDVSFDDLIGLVEGSDMYAFFTSDTQSDIDSTVQTYFVRGGQQVDTSLYDEKFDALSGIFGGGDAE